MRDEGLKIKLGLFLSLTVSLSPSRVMHKLYFSLSGVEGRFRGPLDSFARSRARFARVNGSRGDYQRENSTLTTKRQPDDKVLLLS